MSARSLKIVMAVSLVLTAAWVSGCNLIKKSAKMGDTVKVEYTGKLEDGTIFDSSQNKEPLEFTLGEKQIIPGFEEAVLGMKKGQSKTVNIPVDKAYGPPGRN